MFCIYANNIIEIGPKTQDLVPSIAFDSHLDCGKGDILNLYTTPLDRRYQPIITIFLKT